MDAKVAREPTDPCHFRASSISSSIHPLPPAFGRGPDAGGR